VFQAELQIPLSRIFYTVHVLQAADMFNQSSWASFAMALWTCDNLQLSI